MIDRNGTRLVAEGNLLLADLDSSSSVCARWCSRHTYACRRVLYPWQKPRFGAGGGHNDFFQFSTHEGLGVGGAGHFAIW